MTKEQLIDLLETVPAGEEVAVGGIWFKDDLSSWVGEELTDAQWSRFVYWFDKYQDSEYDSTEALNYALGEK